MENLDSSNEVLDSAYLDSNESIESSIDSAPKLPLSEFLAKENLQKIDGRYRPNNAQLKSLVRYDEVNLGQIDTSQITSMKSLFYKSKRRDFSGIESWNTSNVRSFAWCFCKAEHFNADISAWNVSNARQFRDMFYGAVAFNQPIGAKWNTQNAEAMIGMFCQAKNFNNGGEAFGKSWKMDKVKLVWNMFRGAEKFNSGGLNAWNMSSVTKMEDMFAGAKSFNQPLDSWNVANVIHMQRLFNGAESFNQDLSAWGDKLGKVRNAQKAFANTKGLKIDFLKSWETTLSGEIDNITKGSALESKQDSTKSKGDNMFIFKIKDSSDSSDLNLQERFAEFIQNSDFYNDWLPPNIKETCKIYLAKDGDENFIKGSLQDWDFALCEVIELTFLICKNDKRLDENSDELLCAIIQGRKESDFNKYNGDEMIFDKNAIKEHIANDKLNILFDTKNVWVINNEAFGANAIALKIANAFMIAQSYKVKMQYLEDAAKSHTDSSSLRKYYKEICEFDLHYYRNIPITQDKSNPLLLNIWQKISAVYMIAQTHDELKEIIAQMAQVMNEVRKDDEAKRIEMENKKFTWAMIIIGVLSALGAILAAIPVVEKLAE